MQALEDWIICMLRLSQMSLGGGITQNEKKLKDARADLVSQLLKLKGK
jgi:hypothetical protein